MGNAQPSHEGVDVERVSLRLLPCCSCLRCRCRQGLGPGGHERGPLGRAILRKPHRSACRAHTRERQGCAADASRCCMSVWQVLHQYVSGTALSEAGLRAAPVLSGTHLLTLSQARQALQLPPRAAAWQTQPAAALCTLRAHLGQGRRGGVEGRGREGAGPPSVRCCGVGSSRAGTLGSPPHGGQPEGWHAWGRPACCCGCGRVRQLQRPAHIAPPASASM